MIITKIEPLTSKKCRIELDGETSFALYKGEVSRFHLKEGEELTEEQQEKIKNEILRKRAKLRAMHLLNLSDKTEGELRNRLKKDLYPEDVIEEAITYVKKFGYIDDERYALHFIEVRKESKSRREILMLLRQKTLSAEKIEWAMEQSYGETGGDQEAILKILQKKRFFENIEDPVKVQKIYGYLARKGFRYEDIRQVVQNNIGNA